MKKRWWKLDGPSIKVEPGGSVTQTRSLIHEDQRYLMTSTKEPNLRPVSIVRGEGPFFVDKDGNVFIDFCAGVAVLVLGHNHPEVKRAIIEQVDRFVYYESQDFFFDLQVQAARKLIEVSPGDGQKVFFSNSGTESIEAAIKVAFRSRPLRRVGMAFIGSFHGRTLGALSHTASKTIHKKFYPSLSNVIHLPYPYCYRCPYRLDPEVCGTYCVDIIEEIYFERLADPSTVNYIITEPIQGEGGYIVPPDTFFQRLQRLCEMHGILLIDDEIQAGMGRTGRMFACEHWGLEPDIICLAKGIAGGIPLGATVIPSQLDLEPGAHSNTFGGNAIALNVMLKVFEVIERERLLENAERMGALILSRLNEMEERYEVVGDVRGRGLMVGVEIVKDKRSKEHGVEERDQILWEMVKRGLVSVGCGKSVIRFCPPLIITEEIVDDAMNIFEESVKSLG